MTNKISYKIAAFLRVFNHKMAVWEFCLQDGGVSESFSRKMAAWKICLQDGGNAAFLRVYPQDGGDKQKQRRIYITFS